MRWLTIPLHREADVVSATSRLRAWAEALALDSIARPRLVTVASEMARHAAASGDGSIEFGWDAAAGAPFCAIDLPSSSESLVPTPAWEPAAVSLSLERRDGRTRWAATVATSTSRESIERAVGEMRDSITPSITDFLREQNLEMARMLGALRDHEAELARALEEARRSANEAAAHALQLEEISKKKDEMLAVASHDVRAPIAAAKGALELLQPTLVGQSEDQLHLLAVARRGCDAATHLLANLMSTALIELADDASTDWDSIDVAAAVREVIDLLTVTARHKGVALKYEPPTAALTARGDLMWVRQIATNLVNNAIKYTPKGGQVDVRLSPHEAGALLVVEDNGVGIPLDKVGRVFERLTKLRPRGTAGERGTGIGLYVSKKLIERMGGEIVVAAREGGGTRFEARFPEVSARAVERVEQPRA